MLDKIENILVVVDPTVERDQVVDKAKQIASSLSARVLFFINNANTLNDHSYIYEGIDDAFFETQRKLFRDHYNKLLSSLVEEFQAQNIAAEYLFHEDHHLAEAIIAQAAATGPDLVLKSTHHHSAIERSLISNTDWRLIRKCPVPLLLVKPRPWLEDGSIVTAVDPMHIKAEQSKLDEALLAATVFLSQKLNLKTRVFHSFYPFVSTLFPVGGETSEHVERIRGLHRDKLKELVKSHDIPEDDIHLSEGELVPTLNNYLSDEAANILVIGALSRNVLERAIIGNTAEKILEDCPSDVLILKS